MVTVLRVRAPAHFVLFRVSFYGLIITYKKGSTHTLFEKPPPESTPKAEFRYILTDFLTFKPKKFTVHNEKNQSFRQKKPAAEQAATDEMAQEKCCAV